MPTPHTPQDAGRRRLLMASLLGLLGATTLGGCTRCRQVLVFSPDAPWWLDLAGERDAVIQLGRAYLKDHPEENHLEQILGAIATAIVYDDICRSNMTERESSLAALKNTVLHDYRHAEIVFVDGWLLSRTEARLYAAVALSYKSW